MNLHHDHEAFSELIIAASNELHIPPGIIEKDYYVTLALRELASRVKGMVFKGNVIYLRSRWDSEQHELPQTLLT